MSLKENQGSYKSLPLKLNPQWSPHLPRPIWEGFALAGPSGEITEAPSLDLSHLSLAEALKTAMVQPEYVELLALFEVLENQLHRQEQIPALEKEFYVRWNEESKTLYSIWKQRPEEFKVWSAQKKLKFSDLRPLLRLLNPKTDSETDVLFKAMPVLHCSKQTGSEILELICDLSSLKESELEKLLSSSDPQFWLSSLKGLQAPLTHQKDRLREEKVRSWPWPSKTKGEWRRFGDHAGLRVELYSTSPKDLEFKINELTKICERWKTDL